MRWIIEWSLKFRLLVIALAILLIVFGIKRLRDVPIDVLPEFAPAYIEVQTEAPGLSVAEVEGLVTYNLEELLAGLPWLQSIHSTTVTGLSSIILTFKPSTNILLARQLVSERLTLSYTLPNVAQPPIILQPLSAMSRVMMIGLFSNQVSLIEMGLLARWHIRPALLSVPGVANVAIWGMRDFQLQVQVDPNVLQSNQLKLDQIIATTGNALWVSPLSFLNASTPGTGGWIDTPQQRLEVRHVLPITSPKELAQITIENSKLLLGNVARIVEDHQPLIGDDILNKGTGLLIVIEKFPNANPMHVSHDVEKKLAELQPGLSGIQIDSSIFRPANFIEASLYDITKTFLIGLLFLTIILFIFFGSWRPVLISLITILMSLLVAILVLSLSNTSMNAMILAGLLMVFIIIVDDAIVDVDNIERRLRDDVGISDYARETSIIDIFLTAKGSMIYATLILILTLLPFYFLVGPAQVFFQSVAMAYTLTLIASMLVSLILTPALCLLLLPHEASKLKPSSVMIWFRDRYNVLLSRFLAHISSSILLIISFVVTVFTILGIVWLFCTAPLLPQFKEHNVIIQWQGPPGTGSNEMARITNLATRDLRALPGVQNVAATIGRAVLGDKIVDVNSAEIMVNMYPQADFESTLEDIQKLMSSFPGMSLSIHNYFNEKIKLALTGTTADILIRIFGPDFSILHEQAERIKQALLKQNTDKSEPNLEVNIEEEVTQPQIAITVDLAKAEQYGLKPGEIRRTASTYIAGIEAGNLFQHQKVFPVVVWGTPETRHSFESLKNLLIDTPNNQSVRLADVAKLEIVSSPSFIKHNTISRSIDIKVNVLEDNPQGVINNIKELIADLKLPLEYRAIILSEYQHTISQPLLITMLLAAAFIIFLIFQAIFNDFRLALISFFTLPAALSGGLLMALLMDDLSIFALLGLFAVYGIAARHLILMLLESQKEPAAKKKIQLQAIYHIASARFPSLFITTLATLFALLPLALCWSKPGLEIVSPMALIMIGGLITTLLFNLLIVPALYLFWIEKRRKTK